MYGMFPSTTSMIRSWKYICTSQTMQCAKSCSRLFLCLWVYMLLAQHLSKYVYWHSTIESSKCTTKQESWYGQQECLLFYSTRQPLVLSCTIFFLRRVTARIFWNSPVRPMLSTISQHLKASSEQRQTSTYYSFLFVSSADCSCRFVGRLVLLLSSFRGLCKFSAFHAVRLKRPNSTQRMYMLISSLRV